MSINRIFRWGRFTDRSDLAEHRGERLLNSNVDLMEKGFNAAYNRPVNEFTWKCYLMK